MTFWSFSRHLRINFMNYTASGLNYDMPKASKVKKKVSKVKSVSKAKPKSLSKPKDVNKGPIKISKNYIPKETEKYMCEKHKVFF